MLCPEDKVLLDVCCGRWGWSKEFAKRGWKCIGIDLLEHETPPEGCKLIRMNLLRLTAEMIKEWGVTFAVASTPCEEFTSYMMKNFQPNAPFPALGIKLFTHIESIFTSAKITYVMENVRAAQKFVGESNHHCGPFHLWGNAVPPMLPQGIIKGLQMKHARDKNGKRIYAAPADKLWSTKRKVLVAQIPPLLAACVADYAERILEQRKEATYAKETSAVSSESVRYSLDGREASEGEYKLRELAERSRAKD